ncbi:MAG: AgmX/PglI C-terminal domain-containing protein [Fibrobacteria bacterium]|nr:AgmX/PglI C-terminal domain-containing protein [Fibrobacteria bacterium]
MSKRNTIMNSVTHYFIIMVLCSLQLIYAQSDSLSLMREQKEKLTELNKIKKEVLDKQMDALARSRYSGNSEITNGKEKIALRSSSEINNAISPVLSSIMNHYYTLSKKHPEFKGRIVLSITIYNDGTIQSVKIKKDLLKKHPEKKKFLTFIKSEFQKCIFPPAAAGTKVVKLSYPLVFHPLDFK